MAGGISKALGVLMLLAGIVLLLAGAGAAVYGAMDQQQHEEDAGPLGVGEDQERSDVNEALLYGGIATAVVGLGLTILGIAFMVIGASRERNQMQQQAVTVLQATSRAASGSAAPPAVDSSTAPPGPEDLDLVATQQAGMAPQQKVAIGVAAGIIGVVLLAFVVMGLAGEGPLALQDEPPRQVGEETFSGPLPSGVYLLPMAVEDRTAVHTFRAPDDATVVNTTAAWAAGANGADWFVALEIKKGSGWDTLFSARGPFSFTFQNDTMAGAELRVRIGTLDDYAYGSEDYRVHLRFYA